MNLLLPKNFHFDGLRVLVVVVVVADLDHGFAGVMILELEGRKHGKAFGTVQRYQIPTVSTFSQESNRVKIGAKDYLTMSNLVKMGLFDGLWTSRRQAFRFRHSRDWTYSYPTKQFCL